MSDVSPSSGEGLPAEILSFLFADIRGYTRFTREHGDEAAARLAARLADLSEEVVREHLGRIVELRGDEVMAVFSSARRALHAAVALQRRLEQNDDLQVGIGLDAGEAVPVKDGYRGGALNMAARLCALAGPGEVLATRTVIALSGTVEDLRYEERPPVTLKGFADTVPVVSIFRSESGIERRPGAGVPLALPQGTATFLYTDIEGSTRLWQEHPAAMPRVVPQHDALLRAAIEAHGGIVFRNVGDGACAAFVQAPDALRAAIDAQRALQAEPWEEGIALRVRMAIHSGSVEVREGQYVGHTLNRVARLLSAAHGGQVLLSRAAYELTRDGLPRGTEMRDLGEYRLKDLTQAEHVYQVVAPDLPSEFPPLVSLPDESAAREVALPTGGFLGSLPTGKLVDRVSELPRLLTLVDGVQGGKGQFVLLTGEAGIGKTRLAQEVTVALRDRNFILAAGRCYELEQRVPYYPFLDALAAAYRAAPLSLRSSGSSRWPYLGRLVSESGEYAPDSAGPDEQQRLFRSVVGFLEALSQVAPVALLLDDLHWADESSLQLLQFVARHTRGDRIFILGTYRDTDVDARHPLRRAVLDLGREDLVERIAVSRLDPENTAELVAATLGDSRVSTDVTQLVYGPTEGNPFFAQQILRSLVERGDVYLEHGTWASREPEEIDVPDTVRGVIVQRLSRLSEDTQAILHEASVLGQRFSFDDLQAMTGRSEDEIDAALEEAAGATLLRSIRGEIYAFNHALTQHTLRSDLSPRRRRRLHLAAGTALENLPARDHDRRAAEIAWHFLQADEPERALPWTVRAGDAAEAVFAHSEAEQHYRLAVRLTETGEDGVQRADALARLGGVLRTVARYGEALAILEEAAHSYHEAGDLEREAQVLTHIGQAHYMRGSGSEGAERLQSFVEAMDRPDAPPVPAACLSSLYAALALLYFADVRYDEQLRAAERASVLARESHEDAVLARAEVTRGIALLTVGRRQEAREVLESAVPLAEHAQELDSLARALENLANFYFFGGVIRRAWEYLRRGLEVAERLGDPGLIGHMIFMSGMANTWAGNLADTPLYMERVRAIIEDLPDTRLSSTVDYGLGQLAVWTGDWEAAERHLAQARRLAEDPLNLPMLQWILYTLGELRIQQDRPQDAIDAVAGMLNHPGLQISSTLLTVLAHARMGLGDLEAAQTAIDEAMARCRADGEKLSLMLAVRVAAMLAVRRRRWDDAQRYILEGLELAALISFSVARGWFLEQWGLMLRAQGDREGAHQKIREAVALFRQSGARRFQEKAESELQTVSTLQDAS